MYARRKDWQRHEETVHRRTWKCPLACDSVFETAAAFSDHLHTSHEVDKDPEILKSLIEASSRPSEPSEVLRCPLCEARITTIDRFYRHVGEHLQYLSYFSLPAGLVRERPETDAESVDSASIRVEEESSEHADDTSQEDVAEQEKTGAKSRQAIVESDDAEHFSDKVPDAGALVAENELEIIVIEETPVEEPKDDGDHASQRQSTITRERARERSPARMDFAPESRTVPERSKSQDSVVEIPRNIDEHARWDREGFERLGPLKLTEEDQEGEEDFWGSFVSTKDKKKKKKKTEKKTSFDFGWSDKSAEPVNDVGPPPPLERSSIDKTEVVIRNRSPSPLPRERHGFKVKTISGQTEDIDDRVRRRTPTPSPPPTPPSGDRLVYREREGDRSRPAEREEFVFRTRHKSSSVSPPPQVREFRFDRDRLNTKSAKAKEDRTLDRDIQYREFVEKYEQQRAEAELERKELLARAGREYEEKKYKLERERKEVEERIQVELKKKEEEKKREEEKMAKMVHEKMWQRLTAFGFTDRQIRSIVKGDDKSERTKPGFEDGESLRERERDYYGPSLFPAKEPDYYAYSRDDSYPARDYRTGERVTSRPSRGHYVESEDDLEPIRFEDAEFRRYKLPFKVARTWKGVQKAIREIYQNSEVRDMDEDIISGRYQMLDADDNGILPSTWEMVVKPGHVYKLAFTRNVNHERPYDRHRDYDDELSYRTARLDKELNDLYEETRPRRSHSSVITQNEPVQGRQRRRSQSPPIIRESTKDLGVSLNVPPPPPQQNPFQPANAPNPFRPLEPQLQIDRSAGPSYHGDDEFDFHRRPRRNRSTKAVSFDPYIDDEPGWYPSLETATRGGFRRPEREASHRSRYGDEFHPAASYAYPPPPPRRNNSIQHRRPTWMKAHRDHIDPETLRYYDLPWEYDTVSRQH